MGGMSNSHTNTAGRPSAYRFWGDLRARIEGDPAALTRMPAEIADLAHGMWQRAPKLAGEAATHDDNAARGRLRQLELENDIKQRSFELREREIHTQARERERALADARDHILSLSKALSREQATNQAREKRIAELEMEVVQYRQQIGALIAGAIAEKRPAQPRRALSSPAPRAGTSPRPKKPDQSKPPAPRKAAVPSRHSRQQPVKPKRKIPRRKQRRKMRRRTPASIPRVGSHSAGLGELDTTAFTWSRISGHRG